MRILQRSAQPIWYRLYTGIEPYTVTDEWGNLVETGESSIGYADPVEFRASVSPASGVSNVEQFGDLDNYDHVIVTDDMACPIDEHSLIYIDSVPTLSNGLWSPHNYVVRRVAKSVNVVSIAVRKVDVTPNSAAVVSA